MLTIKESPKMERGQAEEQKKLINMPLRVAPLL